MAENDLLPQMEATANADGTRQELLQEFSIVELEERLEFEAWCDFDCQCPPWPAELLVGLRWRRGATSRIATH